MFKAMQPSELVIKIFETPKIVLKKIRVPYSGLLYFPVFMAKATRIFLQEIYKVQLLLPQTRLSL
jgi:hypothetical protein